MKLIEADALIEQMEEDMEHMEEPLLKLPPAHPTISKTENVNGAISRQAAIDEITEYGSQDTIYMSVAELKRRIERLPSIQPDIILCPDCHYNDGTAYCELHFRDVNAKDFCSWAERRRDANND